MSFLSRWFDSAMQSRVDETGVHRFSREMSAKLANARKKGRGGWQDPAQVTPDDLARQLVEHVAKGDPIDIANYCMFLNHRVPNFAPGIIREAMEKHVYAEVMRQRQADKSTAKE